MNQDKALVIGIVAGEVSGDILGANFMKQMNEMTDNIRWVGVGGDKMKVEGLESLFDMSRLSVMGLVEVAKHLPDLFRARDEIFNEFAIEDIDCFIGIDAPDFNLRLSKQLKKQGVFCVQYVSPSIWIWRENRIHTIKAATDLVLCLFPFEIPIYEKYDHPAVCVGHPLLYSIDQELLNISTPQLRKELIWNTPTMLEHFAHLDKEISHIICVMPGSRNSEVKAIFPLMLRSIEQLLKLDKDLCFIIPASSKDLQDKIQTMVDIERKSIKDSIGVIYDESQPNLSQQIMAMSDLVLLASGTATLEAMLLNRAMVVVYKLNFLTYQIAKRLVKSPYVSLPNILAGEEIVPELIQHEATPENVSREIWQILNTRAYQQQITSLKKVSDKLYQQSSQSAAHVFIEYLTLE